MTRNLTLAAALLAGASMLALTAQAADTTTTTHVVETGEMRHTTSDKVGVTPKMISERSNWDGVRHIWGDEKYSGVNAPHPVFIDMPVYKTVTKQSSAAHAEPAPAGNPYATTVLFDFDRSSLTAESRSRLDTLVSRLHSQGLTRVNIQGHTDSSGSNAYNQGLSHQRASAVADYLGQKGIGAEISNVTWEGEDNQAVTTADGVKLHENRRVEVQAL